MFGIFYFCQMILQDEIFTIKNQKHFEKLALKVFRFQYENNRVYQDFCNFLNIDVHNVKTIEKIPFLPIQFFKSHEIISSEKPVEKIFTSSGTTGTITSKHHIIDLTIYEQSFRQAFSQFYGDIENYVVLALLPSYLERDGSSLVYMANYLIEQSNNPLSGFYLHNYKDLAFQLRELDTAGKSILLIGVTYALLDLVATEQFNLKSTIIMETGGMKGKRREMIREELHEVLCTGFGVSTIHSEYGMTELLSQAYSFGAGVFETPPWMEVLIRDTEDAFQYLPNGKTGGINIIDLANIYSCSFISTQDLGKKNSQNQFEVLGRFDNSDIRGCNLLLS